MKIKQIFAISAIAISVAACHDDDNEVAVPTPQPVVETSNLQVLHLSADAPAVNIAAGGANLIEALDFAMTSDTLTVDSATYSVDVNALIPGSDPATVLSADLALSADTQYIVAALGSVTDGTLGLKVVENPISDVASGYARVQVLHATEAAPTVDVYVTAPGDDIMAASPAITAGYMDASGQIELMAGSYQIRITPTGDKTVVYDTEVDLGDGLDYFLAAVPNIYTGDSPVVLNAHVGGASLKLHDKNSGGDVRAVHAVADAPEVDIIVNNAIEAFADVPFKAVSDYANLSAGDYTLDVAASADNSILALDDVPLTVENGMSYTVIATGNLTAGDIAPVVVDTMGRTRATAAILNVIHGSYSAGNADIYLTADMDISDDSPVLSDVPFRATSGFLEVAPGTYYVTVTPTGTKTEAIGPAMITIDANMRYSIAAVDGMEGGFDVILFDDFTD